MVENKDLVDNDSLFDPTVVFNRIDNALSLKPGQSPEDRAAHIVNLLDWMKSKEFVDDGDQVLTIPSFGQVGQDMGVPGSSPSERENELSDVLDWL